MKQICKKINWLVWVSLFGSIMFLSTSCNKDEDDSVSLTLIGIWQCYYNEIEGDQVYTGDDIDYPYLIVETEYLGFSETPKMPSASVPGEKYKYTYDDNNKEMTLVAIDRDNDLPYEGEDGFKIHILKFTSNELEYEMDVNGPHEIFKYKKVK